MTDDQIIAIQDAHLPGQGAAFDCLAFGRAVAQAELENIRERLFANVSCPCCRETRICVDDCTFANDCPDEAERMAVLREALAD